MLTFSLSRSCAHPGQHVAFRRKLALRYWPVAVLATVAATYGPFILQEVEPRFERSRSSE